MSLVPSMALCADQIQTYSVPKEQPSKLLSLAAPAAPGQAAAAPSPLTWTAPKGWEEKPASRMRLGQFVVPGPSGASAELAVMAFPGDVGGELANVNRWRDEVGLAPITQKDVVSEPVTIGADHGKLYEFAGAAQSTLVGWDLKDGTSYFFKLRGDKAAVAGAKPAMVEFLKSVKFQSTPSMAAAAAIGDPAVANPHGTMPGMETAKDLPAGHPPMAGAMPGMPAGHPAVDSAATPAMPPAAAPSGPQPVLETPANWKEQSASAMVVKSYAVSDEKAGKAAVSITTFPGQVGGALANVNRWRAQIGLGPITEAELPANTKTVDVAGGKGTMVDLTGKDAAGKPARLVAIMAPREGAVWFFKLTGNGPEVEHETANLLKLAKTARLP